MGEVVKLQKPSTKARKTVGKPPRRRGRRSRTALVLGGGGFTGGVYEIGALRALDLLAVNRTVNQFDVYVGTSAGSFVASLAANGVTPEEMMRVVNQQVPTPFRDVDRGTLMRPNLLEFAQSAALLPLRVLGLGRNMLGHIRSASVIDLAVGLAEALPSGMYDGAADPGVPRDRARRPRPLQRLPPARERALPDRHRPRHLRADRARRPRVGRRADLARRGRLDGAADDLQARSRSRAATWSTAASARPPTWTWRSSAARSS